MDAVPPDHAEMAGPLAAYRQRVAEGALTGDASQLAAAGRLQALWAELRGYQRPRPGVGLRGLMQRLAGGGEVGTGPRGIYLVGEVGRGKSMLMDMFFAAAEVGAKRRIHFHQFIQESHGRIFAWKQANPEGRDPIPPLAEAIAAEAALLCFDEFQVNDIADAMILGRLFQALFDRGVVVVATSNIAPDDLFLGQPGRDAFLPFIAIIKAHLNVVTMESGQDYRRARLHATASWQVPAGARAEAALDAAFAELSGHVPARQERLTVKGRVLVVPLAAEGVARFDFQALCGMPLGAGDYLALAGRYHTLILDGIPRLSPENRDEARRFIVLIDTLYDQHVKLVASADAMPDALYRAGDGAVAFQRTASRLEEMRSRAYLELPHLG